MNLDQCYNTQQFRLLARRRLPGPIFHYIDGAADDEVTVKRYRQDGSLVWLLPENEDFEPIQVDLTEQSMVIEGVVVGVIRDGLPLH